MVDVRPPAGMQFRDHPACQQRDAFYWRKRNHGAYHPADHYRDIELPQEQPCGVDHRRRRRRLRVRAGLAYLVDGRRSACWSCS